MADANKIKITALLFGQAREFVGASSLDMEVDEPATVASAFTTLKAGHPNDVAMKG